MSENGGDGRIGRDHDGDDEREADNGAARTSLDAIEDFEPLILGVGARRSKAGEGRRHDRLFRELRPGQLTNNLALREHQHPVTRKQLDVFRCVPNEGASLARELAAKAIEILLGGDVDATGRIVQKNDRGQSGDCPGYERFLLIAPTELKNA